VASAKKSDLIYNRVRARLYTHPRRRAGQISKGPRITSCRMTVWSGPYIKGAARFDHLAAYGDNPNDRSSRRFQKSLRMCGAKIKREYFCAKERPNLEGAYNTRHNETRLTENCISSWHNLPRDANKPDSIVLFTNNHQNIARFLFFSHAQRRSEWNEWRPNIKGV